MASFPRVSGGKLRDPSAHGGHNPTFEASVYYDLSQVNAVIGVDDDYLIDGTLDRTVMVDASAGPVTIKLPDLFNVPGREFKVAKVDSTANVVSIVSYIAGTLINGVGSYSLTAQYDTATLIGDGVNWILF